jgi:iron complex transport system ATP-binding protein
MRLKKITPYMISNNNILTTSNLSIGYTSKATTTIIAENLNLNLQAGKLIALIGANGIGKSTLLRTITEFRNRFQERSPLTVKIHQIDALTVAQNLSVVLTEKLPPSNLTVLS